MIKFKTIKAATIAANNANDVERLYDIEAEVKTSNGVSTEVRNGKVKPRGGENEIATFSGWNESRLDVGMENVPEEEKDALFSAVRVFVKNLREEGSKFNLDNLI